MDSSHSVLHYPDATSQTLQHAIHHHQISLNPHLLHPSPPIHSATFALFRIPSSSALPIFFALHRIPITPVFLNDRWTTSELLNALTTLPVTFLLITPQHRLFIHNLLAHLKSPPTLLCLNYPHASITSDVTHPPRTTPHPPPRTPSPLPPNTYVVVFTSGTASNSKPVPLSQRNIFIQSRYKHIALRFSPTSVYLHLAPLYHLSGFSSSHAAALSHAHHVFLPPDTHPTNPNHAHSILKLIARHFVTHLVAVPATLRLLCDVADHTNLPSVRTVLYGGARTDASLLEHLRVLCPRATVLGTYAMSETASTVLLQQHPHPARTLPYFAVKVVDTHTGTDCPNGKPGELALRGPAVFDGYGAQNGRIKFRNHFFHTGDLVVRNPNGSISIVGRLADIIRSGGETVSPIEVEHVLMSHSAVREAVVVGIPHRVLGEAVVAAVVLSALRSVQSTVVGIMSDCKRSLAHYKCPKKILTPAVLPRNGNGKVNRELVRKMFSHASGSMRAKM